MTERDRRIAAWYEQGLSSGQIARLTDLGRGAVLQILERAGVPRRSCKEAARLRAEHQNERPSPAETFAKDFAAGYPEDERQSWAFQQAYQWALKRLTEERR